MDTPCYTLAPSWRKGKPPIVNGHRGASYNIPEHTLETYQLAFELGADYVEPDFVPTKDGRLIAMHNVDLNSTTNVAKVFPNRTRTIPYKGFPRTAYFSFDFTLKEIQKLRVRQGIEEGIRSNEYDWLFPIPTLEDIATLLYKWNMHTRLQVNGQAAGMYAELKEPKWTRRATGVVMEDLFVQELTNLDEHVRDMLFPHSNCSSNTSDRSVANPPLVIQCFERDPLKYLKEIFTKDKDGVFGGSVPPTFLLLSRIKTHMFTAWNMVDEYLNGMNPNMAALLDDPITRKRFMTQAHERDLAVHAWTERAEKEFLTKPFHNAQEELEVLFCSVGVDGVFAENVDMARRVADEQCSQQGEQLLKQEEQLHAPFDLCWSTNRIIIGCIISLVVVAFLLGYCMRGMCSFSRKHDGTADEKRPLNTRNGTAASRGYQASAY